MVLKSLFVLLCFCTLAPHMVWGFSLERNQSYKQFVLDKKLSEDPQWQRLGHYHKTWSGHSHSQIRGNFFLAPTGADDPQAELLATIDSLFADKSTQCRYLARTRWLKKVLPLAAEDVLPCPERDDWKSRLGASEVYMVFASGDLSSPASSFGHTFLKFHNVENTRQLELLDYGVNFAASTGDDGGALYALKGLLGKYPGAYSMLPYHQKIREYTNVEGRDLWEYKLKLSPEDVAFIIDHLLELDGTYSYYYFADENCSYQMLEVLNLVRPQDDLTQSFHDFVIPLDTLRILEDRNLLEDEKPRPSLQAEWRARYAGLNLSEKKELKEVVKDPLKFHFTEDLDAKAKAEVLEASLAYIAIKEYREQKEQKDQKYALAVQRAKLGRVTDPVVIPPPASPLLSQRPQGAYLGFGEYDHKSFLNLKYRRTFHDLLSDDTGLTPFTHLEVVRFEFRSFFERKNFDLHHFTLVNVLSTAPLTILDYPLSWTVDIGTRPKLAPYADGGVGTSVDLTQKNPTRLVVLARSENRDELDKYAGYVGPQALLLTRWSPRVHSLLGTKYLYSFQDHDFFWDHEVGFAVAFGAQELRAEFKSRREIPEWMTSYIYSF